MILFIGVLGDQMISVIVPVYNVKPYLKKCLDSIIEQTYRDLEILVIDDGSTDGSGAICDDYAKKDSRIKVFHTGNQGLSAARNLGLDKAKGEYFGFVDSDDWVEPNMFEVLLNRAVITDSEAICCGYYRQYTKHFTIHQIVETETRIEGEELICATMKGNVIALYAWNKLYKRDLFDNCRFPENMLFEDIATTWKLLIKCHRVTCVPDALYHYNIRKDSIGNTKSMKNLGDRWMAFKNRYDAMAVRNERLKKICTKGCLDTIGYTWRWLYAVSDWDYEKLNEMRMFAKANNDSFSLCSITTRIALFCAIHSNTVSIFACYWLNQLYRKMRRLDQMM